MAACARHFSGQRGSDVFGGDGTQLPRQQRTSLPGEILRHRLRLLAGSRWELRDVR